MGYEKTIWQDRIVERPGRFRATDLGGGKLQLEPDFGETLQEGTPVSKDNLNKIENGIEELYEDAEILLDNDRLIAVTEGLSKTFPESGITVAADNENPYRLTMYGTALTTRRLTIFNGQDAEKSSAQTLVETLPAGDYIVDFTASGSNDLPYLMYTYSTFANGIAIYGRTHIVADAPIMLAVSANNGKNYGSADDPTTLEVSVTKASAVDAIAREHIHDLELNLSAEHSKLASESRRLNSLWKLNEGISYEKQTDSESAYRIEVPDGARMASVKRIDGKSVVFSQYFDAPYGYSKLSGWMFSSGLTLSLEDGAIRADVATGTGAHMLYRKINIPVGRKIYVSIETKSPDNVAPYVSFGGNQIFGQMRLTSSYQRFSFVAEKTDDNENFNAFRFTNPTACTIYVKSVNIIDITGNDWTAEQCDSIFSGYPYDYNAGELKSASVDSICVTGKNKLSNMGALKGFYRTDGSFSASDGNHTTDFIAVEPSTVYRLLYSKTVFANAPCIVEYDAGKNPIKYTDKLTYNYLLQTEPATRYVRVPFRPDEIGKYSCFARGNSLDYYPYHDPVELPIPEAVRALPGYGIGINDTIRNYIAYENGRWIYHKMVAAMDWGKTAFQAHSAYANVYTAKHSQTGGKIRSEAVSNKLTFVGSAGDTTEEYYAYWGSTSFGFYKSGITVGDIPTAMADVEMYYELAEPEIIDITELMTTELLCETEEGGSLEFHQNTGLRLPVGSEVEYAIEAGSTEGLRENVEELNRGMEALKGTAEELEITKKMLNALWKLNEGITYEWRISPDKLGGKSAYRERVPDGAKMARVNSFGGKSIVWNQLIDPVEGSYEGMAGVGYTAAGGEIRFSGVSTRMQQITICKKPIDLLKGHKYLLDGCRNGSSGGYSLWVYVRADFFEEGRELRCRDEAVICTPKESYFVSQDAFLVEIANAGPDMNGVVIRPQLFDLTKMFGAGNEPTAAEFRKIFPEAVYPYEEAGLMSAAVDKIVYSSGSGVKEYPIPEAVRNGLRGYGFGINNTVRNYIANENGRWIYHRMVNDVLLGELSWNSMSGDKTKGFYTPVMDNASNLIICPGYSTVNGADIYAGKADNRTIGFHGTNGRLRIKDMRYADAAALKEALAAQLLYYEMAAPETVDITDIMNKYLAAIDMDGDGTIEFHQEGDSLLPVPSDVKYAVYLQDYADTLRDLNAIGPA